MGARQTATDKPTEKEARTGRVFKPIRRGGPVSQTEKEFIAKFVMDQPHEVGEDQVKALAKTMRRSPDLIRRCIEEAKDNFNSDAEFYVDMHKQVVKDAYEDGSMDGLEVAMKGAQWAIERMGAGETRVVEKAAVAGVTGTRIQIGVKIGGQNEAVVGVKEVVDATPESD